MPVALRPYRRFPVVSPVTYETEVRVGKGMSAVTFAS